MNIGYTYPSDIYWSQTLYSQFYPDSVRQEKHLRFDHKFVFTRRSGWCSHFGLLAYKVGNGMFILRRYKVVFLSKMFELII